MDFLKGHWLKSVGLLSHGVIFNFSSAKVCSPAIIKAYYFIFASDILIAVTDYYMYFLMVVFIALLHPTQWTIANPVSKTGTSNDRKSCSVFPPARPVTYSAFARWRIILASCLDTVTSSHLFHLARVLCRQIFTSSLEFESICGLLQVCNFILRLSIIALYRHNMASPGQKQGGWPDLIHTVSVRDVVVFRLVPIFN